MQSGLTYNFRSGSGLIESNQHSNFKLQLSIRKYNVELDEELQAPITRYKTLNTKTNLKQTTNRIEKKIEQCEPENEHDNKYKSGLYVEPIEYNPNEHDSVYGRGLYVESIEYNPNDHKIKHGK